MTLLADVAAYLNANGQGTNLFEGRLPDAPDDCAAIFQYAGRSPDYVLNTAVPRRERPALQVLVRARRYQDAEARAYAIWTLLASLSNATLNTTKFYQEIRPLGSPFLLEHDPDDRAVVAANYYTTKEVG